MNVIPFFPNVFVRKYYKQEEDDRSVLVENERLIYGNKVA